MRSRVAERGTQASLYPVTTQDSGLTPLFYLGFISITRHGKIESCGTDLEVSNRRTKAAVITTQLDKHLSESLGATRRVVKFGPPAIDSFRFIARQRQAIHGPTGRFLCR